MKTFLLPSEVREGSLVLDGQDFHYLCNVRRLKKGDSFPVKDKNDIQWLASIVDVEADCCRLILLEKLEEKEKEDEIPIHLFQCLPKGKKGDLIFRQAGETGVCTVQPLTCDHSLVKITGDKERRQKQERWQRVVREALQQSGSSVRTTVMAPEPFEKLKDLAKGTVFYLHQDKITGPRMKERLRNNVEEVSLVIGPEGGFSGRELAWMKQWNFVPVYLGNNTLRVETAALYAIAAVKTILGDF